MINNKYLGFLAVFAILTVATTLLQFQLWDGSSGIFQTRILKQEVENKVIEVDSLSVRNDRLYDEVISLRKNNSVVEGLAREDLGLIKQGEEFYLISPIQ